MSALSVNSVSTQDEFVKMVLSQDFLSYKKLSTWLSSKKSPNDKIFNLLHSKIQDMFPMIAKTNMVGSFNAIVALRWITDTFNQNIASMMSYLKILNKTPKESFDTYITRFHSILSMVQNNLDDDEDFMEVIYNDYGMNLRSVYLPTCYLKELQYCSPILIQEVLYDIFDDPYARTEEEWNKRIDEADRLFGHDDEMEIDIPSVSFLIERNTLPLHNSSQPFKHQVLSVKAMMAMVNKWNALEFKRITGIMRNGNMEESLYLYDMLGPFLHGMMQFFATMGPLSPFLDHVLYRGLYARHIDKKCALDTFFPMDDKGKRISLKDKSLIATSTDRSVAEDFYTTEMLQTPIQRGLLMLIRIEGSGVPIAPLHHNKGQNEVLLLPGKFKFSKHLETNKNYDVVEVVYIADFTMMRKYPRVYQLYTKRRPKSSVKGTAASTLI